ncbi:UNVERIFIED_CONTAM: hypothetical protein HDU68_009455 [Siphonaria sp. JEL0065]|nr:hypothetical protein HDU68_009455 [Siphonaria sp. JEL0065]
MKLNLKRTRPKLTSSLAVKDEGAVSGGHSSSDGDTTQPPSTTASATPHVWSAVAHKGGFSTEETTDFPKPLSAQPSKDTILSELLTTTASTWADDDEMDYTAVPVFGDGVVIEPTDEVQPEPKNTYRHTEKQHTAAKDKNLPPPPAVNPWTRSTALPSSAKQSKQAEHLQHAGFDKSGKPHQYINEWESKKKQQDLNETKKKQDLITHQEHSFVGPTRLNLDGPATTFLEKEWSDATPGEWDVDAFDAAASRERGRQHLQRQGTQNFRQQQPHSELDSTRHPEQSPWRRSAPPASYVLDRRPHDDQHELFATAHLSEKFHAHQQQQHHQNHYHEYSFPRDRGTSRSFDRDGESRAQQSSIGHNSESIIQETWRKNQQHSMDVISPSAPPQRPLAALVQHLPQNDRHQSVRALGAPVPAPVAAPDSTDEKEELSWRRRDSIPPRPAVQLKSDISNQSKQSLLAPSPKQSASHMKTSSSPAMTASVTKDIPAVPKAPAKEPLPLAVTDHVWRKDTGSLDRKQVVSASPTLILKNENTIHPSASYPQPTNAQSGKRGPGFIPAVKSAPASTSLAATTIFKRSPLLEPSKVSTDVSSKNSSKSNTAVSTPRFTATKESSSESGQKLFIPHSQSQQQQKGSASLNISDFDAVMNNIKLMMSKGSGEGGGSGEGDGSDAGDKGSVENSSVVVVDGGKDVISIVAATERLAEKSERGGGEAKVVEHIKSQVVTKSDFVAVLQEQDEKEANVSAAQGKPTTPKITPSVISKTPQLQPTQTIQQPIQQTQPHQIVQPSRQPYSQQQLQQQYYFYLQQQQHLYQQQQQQQQRKLPQGSLVYPLPPQLWNSNQPPTHPMMMLGGPQIYKSYPPGWAPQQQGGGYPMAPMMYQLQNQGHPWAVPFLLPVASPTARFYQK